VSQSIDVEKGPSINNKTNFGNFFDHFAPLGNTLILQPSYPDVTPSRTYPSRLWGTQFLPFYPFTTFKLLLATNKAYKNESNKTKVEQFILILQTF
jgi:hypothetical protein